MIFTKEHIKLLLLSVVISFLFVSECFPQGWVSKTLPINSAKYSIFFVNANTGIMVGGFPYILKSTNGGDNWVNVNATLGGLSGTLNDVYFIDENTGWAVGGRDNSGNIEGVILKTVNGGDNWSMTIMVGTTRRFPTCVHFFNGSNGVLASYSTTGVGQHDTAFYRTSDGGATWTGVAADTITDIWGMNFPSQTMGFAVGGKTTPGQNYHNFYSTGNSGATWTYSSPNAAGILRSVFFPNTTTGYAVGNGTSAIGIKTTNSGVTWTAMTTTSPALTLRDVLFTSALTGYIVGSQGANANIQKTTNGGTNWVNQSVPLVVNPYSVFFLNENTGWVCGVGLNILKTTTGGTLVGINTTSSEVPSQYTLKQNYPNPFNPSTRIDFSITRKDFVSLKIFNSQGKEVTELVKNDLAPGSYSYEFNAASLATGIYFYTLRTGDFTETKKMLLVK